MRQIYLLLGCLCLWSGTIQAQSGFSRLYRYPEDTAVRTEIVTGVFADSACLFFINQSQSISSNNGLHSFFRADMNGTIEDSLTLFNPPAKFISYGFNIIESRNRKYIFFRGYSFGADSMSSGYELLKMDKNLNVVLNRTYQTNTDQGGLMNVIELGGGYLMLLGSEAISNGVMPARIHLLKTDSVGDIIWEQFPGEGNYDIPLDMIATQDGGFLIAGRTYSYGMDDGSSFVLKVDSLGQEVWHRTYNLPNRDGFQKMIATQDGNYVCAGFGVVNIPNSTNTQGIGYMVKINGDGDTLWTRKYTDQDQLFWSVAEASNGDYVAAGSYHSHQGDEGSKAWIIRVDKDGNERWRNILSHYQQPVFGDQYLYVLVALPDGGFVGGGSAFPNTNITSLQDGWLVKVDSMGCIMENCYLGIDEPGVSADDFSLYPNPATGHVLLTAPEGIHVQQVRLCDMAGRVLTTWDYPAQRLDLPMATPGMYLLQLETNKGRVTKKMSIR